MKCKFLSALIIAVSLLAFTGCDLSLGSDTLNSNSNNSSSQTTNSTQGDTTTTTTNPPMSGFISSGGESFSVNSKGETIITSPDGSQENVGNVNDPTIPDEGNGGLLLLLASLSLALSGCTTRNTFQGDVGTVRIDSGTKANASLSLSAYARGSALETESTEAASKEDGQTWIDTQGGGEVAANANTKVGAGNDSQNVEDPDQETEAP
jgi:uncharacterized lipoprotein YehR (DUF1307 family)